SRTVVETATARNEPEDGHQAVKIRSTASTLHIVMVCPEIVPFAKTGGLADMAGSLSLGPGQLGHHVSLIMPAYRHILRAGIAIHESRIRVTASVGGRMEDADVLAAR